MDLLTICIGPEHHDLPLLTYNQNNKKITYGRLSFNVSCNQINLMQIKVNSFEARLNKFLNQNELSIQLSITDINDHITRESAQISCIKPLKLDSNNNNTNINSNSNVNTNAYNNYDNSNNYNYNNTKKSNIIYNNNNNNNLAGVIKDYSNANKFINIYSWEENNLEELLIKKLFSWTDFKKSYLTVYLKESVLKLNEETNLNTIIFKNESCNVFNNEIERINSNYNVNLNNEDKKHLEHIQNSLKCCTLKVNEEQENKLINIDLSKIKNPDVLPQKLQSPEVSQTNAFDALEKDDSVNDIEAKLTVHTIKNANLNNLKVIDEVAYNLENIKDSNALVKVNCYNNNNNDNNNNNNNNNEINCMLKKSNLKDTNNIYQLNNNDKYKKSNQVVYSITTNNNRKINKRNSSLSSNTYNLFKRRTITSNYDNNNYENYFQDKHVLSKNNLISKSSNEVKHINDINNKYILNTLDKDNYYSLINMNKKNSYYDLNYKKRATISNRNLTISNNKPILNIINPKYRNSFTNNYKKLITNNSEEFKLKNTNAENHNTINRDFRHQTLKTETDVYIRDNKLFQMIGHEEVNKYDYELETNFKKYGTVEIHFNEILEDIDSLITKQCSKIFQTFSKLYFNNYRGRRMSEFVNDFNLNNINSNFNIIENQFAGSNDINKLNVQGNVNSNKIAKISFDNKNNLILLNKEHSKNSEYKHKNTNNSYNNNNNNNNIDPYDKNNTYSKITNDKLITKDSINKTINLCHKGSEDNININNKFLEKSLNFLEPSPCKIRKLSSINVSDLNNKPVEKFNNCKSSTDLNYLPSNYDQITQSAPSKFCLLKQTNNVDMTTNTTDLSRGDNTNNYIKKINLKNKFTISINNNNPSLTKYLYKLMLKINTQIINRTIVEPIYHRGETIGEIEICISIKNIPMLKQIQCGVHTERGLDISSSYLVPSIKGKSSAPKQIQDLHSLYSILLQKLGNHVGLRTIYSQRENSKELKSYLNKIILILEYSIKESYLFYEYNKSLDIYKAQKIMIEIVISLISFFNSVNNDIKLLMYKCIEIICNRLELELDLMIIEEDQMNRYFNYIYPIYNNNNKSNKDCNKSDNSNKYDQLNYKETYVINTTKSLNNNNIDNAKLNTTNNNTNNLSKKDLMFFQSLKGKETFLDYINIKLNNGNLYVEMLVLLLEYVLENFPKKVHDEASKHFYVFILSFLYFRLLYFQEEFLSVITYNINNLNNNFSYKSNKFYQDVNEEEDINLKNTGSLYNNNNNNTNNSFYSNNNNNNLKNIIEDNFLNNPVNSLIDWELLFFSRFKKFKDKSFFEDSLKKKLFKVLEANEWKEKLKKRGPTFVLIILEMKHYIKKKIVISRNVRWKDIPGFSLILECIYNDLKNKEAKSISNAGINLMKSFINDSTILNKFINAIINNTNAYDIPSVLRVFDILNSFFQEFDLNRSISSFAFKLDYNLLWKAIRVILLTDHYLCVCKVIWFLYHNAHLMNIDALYKMIKTLFADFFYLLFFHWSPQVRNLFYYFLLFVIQYKLKYNFECFLQGNTKTITRRKSAILEKLNQKDDDAVLNYLSKNYIENSKNGINGEYYSKLRIIRKIITNLKKRNPSNFKGTATATIKTNNNKNKSKISSPNKGVSPLINGKNLVVNNLNNNEINNNFVLNGNDDSSKNSDEYKSNNNVKHSVKKTHITKKHSLYNNNNNNNNNNTLSDKNSYNTKEYDGNTVDISDSSNLMQFENKSYLINNLYKDNEISCALKGVLSEYIIPAIIQYCELEKQYTIWYRAVNANKNSSSFSNLNNSQNINYPIIEVQQLKDDVVEYSEV